MLLSQLSLFAKLLPLIVKVLLLSAFTIVENRGIRLVGSDFTNTNRSARDLISDRVVNIVPFVCKLFKIGAIEFPCIWSTVALKCLANLITDLDPRISKPRPPKNGDFDEDNILEVPLSRLSSFAFFH